MKRSPAVSRLCTAILLAVIFGACSGGGDTTGTGKTTPAVVGYDDFGAHTVGTLTISAGTGQTANAGQAVPVAPVVHARSERGRPLRGATVTLTAENGRGALDATAAVTNESGDVSFPRWTAPLVAGEFAVIASGTAAGGTAVTARVTATVSTTPQTIATETIGTGGGKLTVTSTTSPLNGFTITVPAATVPAGTTFTVSTRPAPTLPASFAVASPIIDIDGPDTRADSVIVVKIPVQGQGPGILHAFLISADNALVPITTTRTDGASLTVSVRQFKNPATGATPAIVSSVGASGSTSTMISRASLILLRWSLPNTPSFTSGFVMKRDNLPFANLGSALAPGGYCAGSSILSGSWFTRAGRTSTARAFFPGLLTNEETLGWDFTDQLNPAIRLATVLQQSYGPLRYSIGEWTARYGQSAKDMWENVLVQIGVSQQPVYIVVFTQDLKTGHAILAYSVDRTLERIYVSDPNFPDDLTRYLQYHSSTQKFDTFLSQANAGPNIAVSPYTWFAEATYFFSEEASGFNSITNQYLTNQLVSQFAPVLGRVKIKSNAVLSADGPTTAMSVQSRDNELRFVPSNLGPGAVAWINLYPGGMSEAYIATASSSDTVRIPLKTGVNKIGMVFQNLINPPTVTQPTYSWADAKVLTITRADPKLKFLVEPATAKVNQSLGAVKIALVDEDGGIVAEQRNVQVSLIGGTAGAFLTGATIVRTGIDGTVTLTGLSVDKSGTGYKLMAESVDLISVSSASFNITSGGAFSGRVFDAVTNNGLDGVTVTVRAADNSSAASATSSGGGNWTAAGIPAGTYSITASRTGYVTTSLASQTMSLPATVVEPIPLVPSNTPGGISGSIRNASTTALITTSISVELRSGVNVTTGTTTASVTTAAGSYTFTNVPAGAYTVVARGTGYAEGSRTGIVVGAGSTISQQDILLSTSSGAARVVLTWGATPSDLDSHFTGPVVGASSRFWISYSNRGVCSSSPFACLDVDDVSAFGPETITLSQLTTGVYRYYVYDYSNRSAPTSTALGASGAKVQFYVGNTLRQTFFVPGGVGNAWAVFDWDGTNLTVLNNLYVISGTPQPALRAEPSAVTTAEAELRHLIMQMPAKPPR